jgi:hypothetical protein
MVTSASPCWGPRSSRRRLPDVYAGRGRQVAVGLRADVARDRPPFPAVPLGGRERRPVRGRATRGPRPAVAAHSRIADRKSEFLQLTDDALAAPARILTLHPPDELLQLRRDPRSAATLAPPSRYDVPPPGHALPPTDCLRLHDPERLAPARPPAGQQHPQEAVSAANVRPPLRPGLRSSTSIWCLSAADSSARSSRAAEPKGTSPTHRVRNERSFTLSLRSAPRARRASPRVADEVLASHRLPERWRRGTGTADIDVLLSETSPTGGKAQARPRYRQTARSGF